MNEVKKPKILKLAKVPTEKQIQTWENEGGLIKDGSKLPVIVNGIVCETWQQRVQASILPLWKNVKNYFKGSQVP